MADPILKWAGGKRSILDNITELFPSEYQSYHEPFLGAGAVVFSVNPATGTINDSNVRLMNFYTQIKERPNEVIKQAESFSNPTADTDPSLPYSEHGRTGKPISEFYYQQRERFNNRPNNEPFDPIDEAALLLYLNRTGFNGLYRENNSGMFNVPIGNYTNPDWIRNDQIQACSDVLQSLELYNTDFTYITDTAKPGDLVYFDPPYKPHQSVSSFTEYTADSFGPHDQKRLLETILELSHNQVYCVISNSGAMTPQYTDTGLHVYTITNTRSISQNTDSRGDVTEILATNYPLIDALKSTTSTT